MKAFRHAVDASLNPMGSIQFLKVINTDKR